MAEGVVSGAKRRLGWRQVLRVIVALVGLLFCYRLITASAWAGASGLLTVTAFIQSTVGPADMAVRLAPGDPDAHYTRALELVNGERLSEALDELRQTTRMRPNHYYQWLDLGVTLDRLDDSNGAIAALHESIRLAPSFAQPRWQLGNLLYRQGRFDEAFAEMRAAAKSSPPLGESLLGLAWVAADGDVAAMERFVGPDSPQAHLALANFLAKHEKGGDAIRHLNAAGPAADDTDRATVRETIGNLIAGHQFADAYTAWINSKGVATSRANGSAIVNGDFVDPILQNDPGFNWQLTTVPNVAVSIDPDGPMPGTRSLNLTYVGEHPPGAFVLSHLVLVQPATHYSLSFMSRSEAVASGGPPVIWIVDAGSEPVKILAEPIVLPTGTSAWKAANVDFTTNGTTQAIAIMLRRQGCSEDTCPIFGKLWLSRFELLKKGQR